MSRPLPLNAARPPCKHGRSGKKYELVEVFDIRTRRTSRQEFLTCNACGAVRSRHKGTATTPRWSAWRMPNPGVCYRCGCSDDRACEEGCGWANEQKTVCTSCVAP